MRPGGWGDGKAATARVTAKGERASADACRAKARTERWGIRSVLSLAMSVIAWAASAGSGPDGLEMRERPQMLLPRQALGPEDVAVIINDADPLSRKIGAYYAKRRAIPAGNLIHVRFDAGRSVLAVAEFKAIQRQVLRQTPARVQAYALAWAEPYRVGCMSVTTAFAAGYDESFCAVGCRDTRSSRYFASASSRPFADLGVRPSIALAGTSFEEARALIDRGVSADETRPGGTGYLVETADAARSVRAHTFGAVLDANGSAVELQRVRADAVTGKGDILFYFTGAERVPGIATNRYRPGAIADHLTSTGGQLTDSAQMSSLEWLRAGATGSYGTVVEPCNILGKFPDPGVLISRYLSGATLIEAYWKSVLMPGQGIFIGEPLARPFGGYEVEFDGDAWVATTYALTPGRYRIESADQPIGPYQEMGVFEKTGSDPIRLRLAPNGPGHYRIVPAD